MNRKLSAILFSAGLLLALPQIAMAGFTTNRGVRVNPVDGAVFEVIPKGAAGGATYWCAASDYAQRGLGAPWTAKIYVVRGMGKSVTTGRKSSVQFTLNPDAAGIAPDASALRLGSFKVGDNMSVQQAHTYCAMESPRF